jgi:hypothetical protein
MTVKIVSNDEFIGLNFAEAWAEDEAARRPLRALAVLSFCHQTKQKKRGA